MQTTLTNTIKKGDRVKVDAREWFDKTYGNSYFSARIYINGELIAILPFHYGYGDQYETAATKWLADHGYLESGSRLWQERDRLGFELYTEKKEALKRDTKAWGEISHALTLKA